MSRRRRGDRRAAGRSAARRLPGPDRIPAMLHPDEPPYAGFEARRLELGDLSKAEQMWRERMAGARYEDIR